MPTTNTKVFQSWPSNLSFSSHLHFIEASFQLNYRDELDNHNPWNVHLQKKSRFGQLIVAVFYECLTGFEWSNFLLNNGFYDAFTRLSGLWIFSWLRTLLRIIVIWNINDETMKTSSDPMVMQVKTSDGMLTCSEVYSCTNALNQDIFTVK